MGDVPGSRGDSGGVPPMGGAEVNGKARTAMIVGLVGLVLWCIPGIIAIVLGGKALSEIRAQPNRYTGRGMAIAGIVTGIAGVVLGLLGLGFAVLLPVVAKSQEMSNRVLCASNLRAITNSMSIYAAANADQFPVYPYAPYSPGNAGTTTKTGELTADKTIDNLYRSRAMNGSVLGAQWILVLQGLSPKFYLCKSDVNAKAPAELTTATIYHTNFQADNQVSYSFAYPYGFGIYDGKQTWAVGGWWRTTSVSVPLAADMAPLNGTGKPRRNVAPGPSAGAGTKVWNSGNHGGDGQNVAFADVHVEFKNRPDVGHTGDNIYTVGDPAGPTDFGGTQPVKTVIKIYTPTEPYDIYMVPTRNLDTGGL